MRIKPRNRLQVVIENIGQSIHDHPQSIPGTLKIGDEYLHPTMRQATPNGSNRLGEDVRTTVGKIVTCDRGDNGVLQLQPVRSFGDAPWLPLVQRQRRPVFDCTEAAVPRASIAEDHERCRALPETLTDDRTSGLFTNRVELKATQKTLNLLVLWASTHPHSQPRWPLSRRLIQLTDSGSQFPKYCTTETLFRTTGACMDRGDAELA